MYIPKHFEETRTEVLHEFIKANPLGALVGLTSQGLVANHIPLQVATEPAPFGLLQGHIARSNPFWRQCVPQSEALVIFQGPSAYISPTWYPSKKQNGRAVPTWNYAVIHAYGPIRFIDDKIWLRAFVEKLTQQHEAGQPHPWKVTDAPADYIENQLGAIIGLEIPITRLIGKWKLSQNRSPEDQEGMAQGLSQEGSPSALSLARLVRPPQNIPS